MDKNVLIFGASLLVAALLITLLVLVWRRRRDPWYPLKRALKRIARDVRRDLLLPDGMGGRIQLDYLVLTRRGILVLDARHAPGVVFGGDRMDEWAVLGEGGRFGIRNPQEALFDRLAAVRAIASSVPVEGFVVFTNKSEFTKGVPSHVILVSQLEQHYAPGEAIHDDKVIESFLPHWQRLLTATGEEL